MNINKANTQIKIKPFNWNFVLKVSIVASLVVLGFTQWVPFFIKFATPFGSDLTNVFKPAAMAMLHGQSPYSVPGFFSPPWVLLLYLPFAILPYPFDLILLVLVSLSSFVLVARKLGAKLPVIVLLLATPQLLWGIVYGNNDFMVALGFILPPQIGLIFLSTKPQIGFVVGLFLLYEAWKDGGIKRVLIVSTPVILLTVISVLVFGSDLLAMFKASNMFWNVSFWPNLIPVGLVLLYLAFKNRKKGFAILSGPFVAPYIGVQSLPLAILGLLPNQIETIIAILSLWVVWLIKGPL